MGHCGFGGKPETRGLLSYSSRSKTAADFYFFCISWKESDSVNMQVYFFSTEGLPLGERNVLGKSVYFLQAQIFVMKK